MDIKAEFVLFIIISSSVFSPKEINIVNLTYLSCAEAGPGAGKE